MGWIASLNQECCKRLLMISHKNQGTKGSWDTIHQSRGLTRELTSETSIRSYISHRHNERTTTGNSFSGRVHFPLEDLKMKI